MNYPLKNGIMMTKEEKIEFLEKEIVNLEAACTERAKEKDRCCEASYSWQQMYDSALRSLGAEKARADRLVKELETRKTFAAELAKSSFDREEMSETLKGWIRLHENVPMASGVCFCGIEMSGHPIWPADHTPEDMGQRFADDLTEQSKKLTQ